VVEVVEQDKKDMLLIIQELVETELLEQYQDHQLQELVEEEQDVEEIRHLLLEELEEELQEILPLPQEMEL
jgi:hypothetical protein